MTLPNWLVDLLTMTLTFRAIDFTFWVAASAAAGALVVLSRRR